LKNALLPGRAVTQKTKPRPRMVMITAKGQLPLEVSETTKKA
jgi:hypothetical protein